MYVKCLICIYFSDSDFNVADIKDETAAADANSHWLVEEEADNLGDKNLGEPFDNQSMIKESTEIGISSVYEVSEIL